MNFHIILVKRFLLKIHSRNAMKAAPKHAEPE